MNKMSTESRWEEFYLGSRRFLFLSDKTGLPIDQVNFVLGQIAALAFAYMFRVYLHPSVASPQQRHLAAFTAGTIISYFCFGKQILLAVALVVLCYLLLILLPPSIVHHGTLCASLTFLSAVHLQRQFYQDGVYVVDITGPLMIMVQKATSLAYSLYDGCIKDEPSLTPLQNKLKLKEKPTALEYFSYLMCFQSILSGPLFMFADYQDFIHGTHYIKYASMKHMQCKGSPVKDVFNNNYASQDASVKAIEADPNPTSAAMKKVYTAIFCAICLITFRRLLPVSVVRDPAFLIASVWYKLFYIIAITMTARQLYYTAWYLGDGVCMMSGLGFNGYDAEGNEKWDLITSIDMLGVELGTSFKTTLESWNITTMLWLRFLVYERAPFQATLLTYTLSSLWHGFYPGYYLTFLCGAFFTLASRAVRRFLRPVILPLGEKAKQSYDFLTFLVTRLVLSYATFPFVLLRFWDSVNIYLSLWYYLHILGLAALIVLPPLTPYMKRWVSSKSN